MQQKRASKINELGCTNKEKKKSYKGTRGDKLCEKGLNVKVGLIQSSIFRCLNR